jgi:hypothetical protein
MVAFPLRTFVPISSTEPGTDSQAALNSGATVIRWRQRAICGHPAHEGGTMAALFAYSFPLLSVFWTMLMFAGIFLMIFFVVWCFIDNFRRHDHHGMAKAGWAILILFLPIFGALIYIIARPSAADVVVVEADTNVVARAA